MLRLVAAAIGAVAFATAATPLPLVVVSTAPNTSAAVARVDRTSLARIGKPITLGEYHADWALSPDRSRLAFGISAPGRTSRIGVRVVDLARWRVSANLETGIAGEVLWWPSPRRLVAALGACICLVQQTGFAVADPVAGRVLRHVHFPRALELFGGAHAVAQRRLALLLGRHDATSPSPAALALVAANGSYRIVLLDRVLLPLDSRVAAALVAVGGRVIVVAGGIAADVDPVNGAVEYHELAAPAAGTVVVDARAVGDVVAVSASDAARSRGVVGILDTGTWQLRTLQAAPAFAVAGTTILVYGRGAPGVRGYGSDGSPTFSLLGSERIDRVATSGATAYIRTLGGVTVVADGLRGNVLKRLRAPAVDQVIDPARAQ